MTCTLLKRELISTDFEIDIYRFIVMSSLKKSTVVVNLGPLIKEAARVERANGASFIGQATQTTSYNFPDHNGPK